MFHKMSHDAQTSHLSSSKLFQNGDFDVYEKSVDAWRHHRMMAPFQPFAELGGRSWLTIGDGNGWDATRLTRMGASDVTASDLSSLRLEQAKQEGLIKNYRVENAESLSLADDSIDIVFCKEAFHHFPRPWLGIYEMLRVAKHCVLLIEPRDWIIDRGPLNVTGPLGAIKSMLQWLKTKVGFTLPELPVSQLYRLGDRPNYEEVGNYVFSLSSREVEKVALGLNLPAIAFKGINDHFEEGLWQYPANEANSEYKRLKLSLEKSEKKSRTGIGGTSYLLTAFFLIMPTSDLIDKMQSKGWYFKALDRNPYLKIDQT